MAAYSCCIEAEAVSLCGGNECLLATCREQHQYHDDLQKWGDRQTKRVCSKSTGALLGNRWAALSASLGNASRVT